jgi:hypothetical protein
MRANRRRFGAVFGEAPHLVYAHGHLLDHPHFPLGTDAGFPSPSETISNPLAWHVLRLGARRFLFRMLVGAAFSLTLTELLLIALVARMSRNAALLLRQLELTLSYSLALMAVAGTFLLFGLLDPNSRAFLVRTAQRRRVSPHAIATAEARASTWLLLFLGGAPLLMTTIAAGARAGSLDTLLRLSSVGMTSLVVTSIGALGLAWGIARLRRAHLRRPSAIVLVVILLPELLRLIDPSVPTLRTLIAELPSVVLRWSPA